MPAGKGLLYTTNKPIIITLKNKNPGATYRKQERKKHENPKYRTKVRRFGTETAFGHGHPGPVSGNIAPASCRAQSQPGRVSHQLQPLRQELRRLGSRVVEVGVFLPGGPESDSGSNRRICRP